MPTTLCIVPMFASEAGMKNSINLLITQQALEICPQAKSIVVCSIYFTKELNTELLSRSARSTPPPLLEYDEWGQEALLSSVLYILNIRRFKELLHSIHLASETTGSFGN